MQTSRLTRHIRDDVILAGTWRGLIECKVFDSPPGAPVSSGRKLIQLDGRINGYFKHNDLGYVLTSKALYTIKQDSAYELVSAENIQH